MTKSANRIEYLDLLKLFAIFLMVQGHTIDTFLSPEFRSNGNSFYKIWSYLRGYTAPIFFFTSGFLLSYLLKNEKSEVKLKKRIKNGLIRSLGLILLGYLLRYPSHKVFDFSHVTLEGWKIFFTVDALHLISLGLVTLLSIFTISKFLKMKVDLLLLCGTLLVIISTSYINGIDWSRIVCYPLTGYFYFGTGSYFPLFPYLSYIFIGAFIGVRITEKSSKSIQKYYLLIGFIFILSSLINVNLDYSLIAYKIDKIIQNIGVLLVLNEVFKSLLKFFPEKKVFVKKIADKSLLIYIVHLIILYGCAWFPGLYKLVGPQFNLQISILFAILMIILMYSLVIFTNGILKKTI